MLKLAPAGIQERFCEVMEGQEVSFCRSRTKMARLWLNVTPAVLAGFLFGVTMSIVFAAGIGLRRIVP